MRLMVDFADIVASLAAQTCWKEFAHFLACRHFPASAGFTFPEPLNVVTVRPRCDYTVCDNVSAGC